MEPHEMQAKAEKESLAKLGDVIRAGVEPLSQQAIIDAAIEKAALLCLRELELGLDDERGYYGKLMAEAIREMKGKPL